MPTRSAFNTIYVKEKASPEFLLKDPSDDKWDEVHDISQRIADRLRLVKPYLPGYQLFIFPYQLLKQ